jgi:hypothetical protein
MQISRNTIRKQLKKLLGQVGIIGLVEVTQDIESRSLMAIRRDDNAFFLTYHPNLLSHVKDLTELQLFLKHEICHLFTCPTYKIPIIDSSCATTTTANLEYVDIFREYLADKEFNERYPNEKAYLNQKKKIFKGDKLLSDLQKFLKGDANQPEGPFVLFGYLFRIFYDCVYFHIVGDYYFQEWCFSRGVQSWYKFFLYIMDDMQLISARQINYEDKLKLVLDSFMLAVTINLQDLLLKNEISTIMQPEELETIDYEIKSLWKSRQIRLVS